MKALFLSLIFIASTSVFADQPNLETARLAKVLVNNPYLITQLEQAHTDQLSDVQISETLAGVTDFVLTFERSCFCQPKTATVNISEDIRPTFSDGAPIYIGTVTFTEK